MLGDYAENNSKSFGESMRELSARPEVHQFVRDMKADATDLLYSTALGVTEPIARALGVTLGSLGLFAGIVARGPVELLEMTESLSSRTQSQAESLAALRKSTDELFAKSIDVIMYRRHLNGSDAIVSIDVDDWTMKDKYINEIRNGLN